MGRLSIFVFTIDKSFNCAYESDKKEFFNEYRYKYVLILPCREMHDIGWDEEIFSKYRHQVIPN